MRNPADVDSTTRNVSEMPDPAGINLARPQRQCTTRSLAYKFVDQNSDDEDVN